jgi:hypothetical protein
MIQHKWRLSRLPLQRERRTESWPPAGGLTRPNAKARDGGEGPRR